MQKREFKYEFPFFKYYFDTAPCLKIVIITIVLANTMVIIFYLKECRGVYGDKNTIFQFNEGI